MKLTTEKINELLGVDESFHASYKLIEILSSPSERELLFTNFFKEEQDLSFDWFTEYFQAEHSDRKGKKQDFTPDGIIRVASGVLGPTRSNADICAGTGGLTIKRYAENPDAQFYCEEFSDRALPFLLFNLAIRNINAVVLHGDSLSREFKAIYKLTKSTEFSSIEIVDEVPATKSETVIMNPPYSLPWNPLKEYLEQERFSDFDVLAPKSKADYAFLLQGIHQLKENGVMSIILPHGVLFRGAAEEKIRKKLIEKNLLDAVIGLPAKAFLNTDIPTVLLVLKKNRLNKDILFIDASKEFKKEKAWNVLEDEHVAKILEVFQSRKAIDKFSSVVTIAELKENDFNLNIPRYVDTFEPEPVKPLSEIMAEMKQTEQEIAKNNIELAKMMNDLVGTTPEADRQIKEFASFFSEHVGYKDSKKPKRPIKRAEPTKGEQLSLL